MQVQSQTHHRENIYLGDLQTMAPVCCARAIGEMVLMPPVTNPNPPHTPHKTSYFTIFSYLNYRLHLCVCLCVSCQRSWICEYGGTTVSQSFFGQIAPIGGISVLIGRQWMDLLIFLMRRKLFAEHLIAAWLDEMGQ